jgi:hypothetical protein
MRGTIEEQEQEIDEMRGMLVEQRRSINVRKEEVSLFEALDYARNAIFFEDKFVALIKRKKNFDHHKA